MEEQEGVYLDGDLARELEGDRVRGGAVRTAAS